MIAYPDDFKTAVVEFTCEKLDLRRRPVKEDRPASLWAICQSGNRHVSLYAVPKGSAIALFYSPRGSRCWVHSLRASKLPPRRPATHRCQAAEDEIGKPLLADLIPELLREPTKILLAWQINPHCRAPRCTTCFSSRLPAGKSRGPSSEGKRSSPEPFMPEKQAEEVPGQARPRRGDAVPKYPCQLWAGGVKFHRPAW